VYKVSKLIDEQTELMKEFLKRNTDLSSNVIQDMFEYKESYAEITTKRLNNSAFLNNEKLTRDGMERLTLDEPVGTHK
jgi:hypothetical protein